MSVSKKATSTAAAHENTVPHSASHAAPDKAAAKPAAKAKAAVKALQAGQAKK